MLPKFVQGAPSTYAHTLSTRIWRSDDQTPAVPEVVGRVRQYEDSVSGPLQLHVSALEEIDKETKKLAEKL